MALDFTQKLNKTQLNELGEALRKGFPNRDELEALFFFEVGESLDEVTGPGTVLKMVLDIIQWAEANGRMRDLVQAMVARNPDNPQVKRIAPWLEEAGATPAPPNLPPQAVSNYQQWFDTLVAISYKSQVQQARAVLQGNPRRVAAVLIDGKAKCGQKILVKYLVRALEIEKPRYVPVNLGQGVWQDFGIIWSQINSNFNPNATSITESLDAIIKAWETQNIVIVFDEVDNMVAARLNPPPEPPPTYLMKWIDEFWRQLLARIPAQQAAGGEGSLKSLLFILIRYSAEAQAAALQNSYPEIGLWLKAPDAFDEQIFDQWLERLKDLTIMQEPSPLPPVLTPQRLRPLAKLRPYTAFEQICEICGWKGAMEVWIKIEAT